MKAGDIAWVPWPSLAGGAPHARPWRIARIIGAHVDLEYMSQCGTCDPDDLYPTREACEAAIALRAAAEAVAKARDAVVEAAKAWDAYAPEILRLQRAVRDLLDAERAEAEVRAKLEALR